MATDEDTAAPKKKSAPKVSTSEKFLRLGLIRDWDFALHLPLRYEDETQITAVRELRPGTHAQIQGKVINFQEKRFNNFRPYFLVTLEDDTGRVVLKFFRFCDKKTLAVGNVVRAYGEVVAGYLGGVEINQPRVRKAADCPADLPSSLTPIYSTTEGLTQPVLRKRIARALLDLDLRETIPAKYTKPLALPAFARALNELHSPSPITPTTEFSAHRTPEWRRVIFDEFLAQQIYLRQSRTEKGHLTAPALNTEDHTLTRAFSDSLPFTLTGAQKRVTDEINAGLSLTHPMQRLVAGDVGSGKTVIAALAALKAVENRGQAAVMAPTEILARQHFEKFSSWFNPLGVSVILLVGSLSAAEKRDALEKIASGTAQVIVGTHALIQTKVVYHRLVLAVIDEQHRFGVAQRLKLMQPNEEGWVPHQLLLTATPIPRTLAMSYLADLDVSFLDELPPGRQPVTTKLVSCTRAPEVLNAVAGDITQGSQCYWVCPLIEDNEKADLTAAVARETAIRLAHPELRTALLHSKMPAEDKQAVMAKFAAGELDLLVSTTVIEVGVDVPNATVMVIEHAERFGLSQLHQLRGRVGRGSGKSVCLMLFDPELTDAGKARLKVIRETTDGFEIAREDLRLRGPGEFLGARQSGAAAMRFADPSSNQDLLKWATYTAENWLNEDPAAAQKFAARWFDKNTNYLQA